MPVSELCLGQEAPRVTFDRDMTAVEPSTEAGPLLALAGSLLDLALDICFRRMLRYRPSPVRTRQQLIGRM